MGPRSCERGKRKKQITGRGAVELQWGRVRVNAERTTSPCANGCSARLQWGRVRVNAERQKRCVTAFYDKPLQWGRVRVNAESKGLSDPWKRNITRFNGAAFV